MIRIAAYAGTLKPRRNAPGDIGRELEIGSMPDGRDVNRIAA